MDPAGRTGLLLREDGGSRGNVNKLRDEIQTMIYSKIITLVKCCTVGTELSLLRASEVRNYRVSLRFFILLVLPGGTCNITLAATGGCRLLYLRLARVCLRWALVGVSSAFWRRGVRL